MKAKDSGAGAAAALFFRNGHLLGLTVAVLLVAGLSALANLPRIEDPRITTRNATIITLLPGASATRVEALVTDKIEDRLRELSEIKKIESTSRAGVSLIQVELQDAIDASDNEEAFSKVRDKLADAERDLPPEASKPEFDDKRGAVAYSLIVAIRGPGAEPAQLGLLKRLGEELADRLRNLPGTELVRLYGAPDEEMTVTVDPAELATLGLSPADIARAIAGADAKAPAGAVRTSQRDLLLEVMGELDSVGRIASVPIAGGQGGELLRLGDVAQVSKSWQEPPRDIALADGRRAVLVAAKVEKNVRVDNWASSARDQLRAFAAQTDDRIHVDVAFDQSGYTEHRLSSLGGNLGGGALVVVLVVLLGMGWRAALIVGTALPLAAAATLFGLTFFGQQIHQMTVFGMIIAIGLLIDNAIVVTDEVKKRLHRGLGREEAVTQAVGHLMTPLSASTLTTVLGFMPVFLLPGNVGDFVSPIAISVLLALLASLAISMTVIAALAGRFMPRPRAGKAETWWRQGVSSAALARTYRNSLDAALRRPAVTLAMGLVLPVLGFGLASTLGNQFFPPADRDQFEVELRLGGGASLARTAETAREVETVIREQASVERIDWLVGASYPSVYYNLIMDKDNDPAYAHGIVKARNLQAADALIPKLQAELDAHFPEAQIIISAFGQGPPYESPVGFRIVGPETDRLRAQGEELRRIMHGVPGIVHTQASIMSGRPKLWLAADEDEARLLGLSLSDLAGQLQGALEGHAGGSVLEDLEELPVRIRYGTAHRGSVERVASQNFVAPGAGRNDAWVPMQALGSLKSMPELDSITRRNGERVNKILGFTSHGVLPMDVTRAILEKLAAEGFQLDPGYRLEVAGDSEEQGRAIAQLMTYLPVLLLLMVGTLVLSFRSLALAGLVGTVALLSVGLGMLSLWLAGFPLGFNPIIGSAGLVGVAINGSIVVLAAIRANPQARSGHRHAIVEETMGATRHILSTTFTTMGGFLPLLVLTGGDFWPPLAVVIAGGVGFAVSLSLFFTPATYYLLHARQAEKSVLPGDGAPVAEAAMA